jgi:signal transduction histidine kinase
MKLRILHKGLILLLIPAALQGFLLYQLYASFQEVDRLSRDEERISRAIAVEDQIISLMTEVLKAAWRSSKHKGETLLDPETFRTRMNELVAQEKTLMSDNLDILKLMELVSPLTDDVYQFLKTSDTQTANVTDLQRVMTLGPRAHLLGLQQHVIDEVKSKALEKLQLKREETRASRARMETQIFFSAVAEIILTLALLVYFLRDVTERLKVLMLNAASVPSGKPLTMHVGGGDELAYLDDVLHQSSLELERAAQHRKTITEMVSHDLRSPLSAANLSLELLLRPDAFDSREEHDQRVQSIKRNLTRLTAFVEDLLAIDQFESGKLNLSLDTVDLQSLVQETIDSLSILSQEKKLTLKNHVTAQEVVADKIRVQQVLVNFISNAIKFSPVGGAIVVSAGRKPKSVTVLVADEGPGISESQQAQLFERFRQVGDPTFTKGYGLGLFICKVIIERHGGKLGVESQPGKGSRFWFSLPMDDNEDL